jgi:lipopolysaccharide export system protein LptA
VIVRKNQRHPAPYIRSERAFIDASKERVELPDKVRIEQGSRWITGTQLILDQTERQLRLGTRGSGLFPAGQDEQAEPLMSKGSTP